MARFDLTDFEWSVIQPLLPQKSRGVPRVDDRRVLNGIFWRLRTGAPWADVPARYGPHTTCVNRFNRWRKAGVWAMLLEAVSEAFEGDVQMTDSSSIRVHQHAANGQKNRPIPLHGSLAGRPDDQDPCARRRALGRPIRLKLTEGQAHDGRSAADMFDTVEAGDILLAARGGARGGHPADAEPCQTPGVQSLGLPAAQRRGAVLQQAQTLPRRRNPIRQARRQPPRFRPTRSNANMAA